MPAAVSEQTASAACAVSDIWMSAVQPQDSRQNEAAHSRVVDVLVSESMFQAL